MQVVAYTSSPLKRAILNQFVRCDVILPNAFVGTLTRESVTNALQAGIDHDIIIRYLTQHADPHTASCTPVVPAVPPPPCFLFCIEPVVPVLQTSPSLLRSVPSSTLCCNIQQARALAPADSPPLISTTAKFGLHRQVINDSCTNSRILVLTRSRQRSTAFPSATLTVVKSVT